MDAQPRDATPTDATPTGAVTPDAGTSHWRPPLFWRFVLGLARAVLPLVCRLRVTGDVPDEWREGPLILAGNHIGTFDPVIFTAAARTRRIAPRMMATGGVFRVPIIGPLMRIAGHIPVDRGRATVANAIPDAIGALRAGSVVFIYPEGRIGLDPALWPERAKSGLARLALASGAPVVPVATWGSHEVVAYHGMANMIRTVISSIWRRPTVRIHFGAPVDLSDLRAGVTGDAQRASDRIMDAITADLVRLRSGLDGGPAELRLPRYRDRTKPVSVARVHRPRRAAASTRTTAVHRTAPNSR
jgi:1-acyl-sn-glycerol-3-phosphate acyltransferase